MKKRFFLSLALVSLLVFTGCYSLSTYQNADTVREGKFAGGLGIGVLQFADPDTDGGAILDTNEFMNDYQMMELFLRYGLTENMDMGFKIYSTNLSMDWKWRFIDLGIFRVATDIGGVYSNFFGLTGWAINGNLIFDIRPVDAISLYFGPKYQYVSYGFTDDIDVVPQHYYGGFVGFKFQLGAIALMPEVAFYKVAMNAEDINASTDDGFLFQPGVAIQFGF